MADQVRDCKEQGNQGSVADHVKVGAEVDRLRQAEQDRLRAEVCQTFAGTQVYLQATTYAVAMPDGTGATREAPGETIWKRP